MRSHRYIDINFYREMSYHWQYGLDKWTLDGLAEQFKGRMLSEKNMRALEQVLERAKEINQEVKVYDLSRIAGRIRKMKRGVMKAPTVTIGEKRYKVLRRFLDNSKQDKSVRLQPFPIHGHA